MFRLNVQCTHSALNVFPFSITAGCNVGYPEPVLSFGDVACVARDKVTPVFGHQLLK